MNISGVQSAQFNAMMAYGTTRKLGDPPPPPPPSQSGEGDTVQFSTEAMNKLTSAVPDSVTAAVADLQGSQTTMSADFKTIGDYFANNGGRGALDAYMRSNFTQEQLQAFPPPTEGEIINPQSRPSQNLPAAVNSAVSDLKGDQANMGDDLKAIGDYFKENGGREARHAFMQANFTKDQLDAFREFRQASQASNSNSDGSTSAV